MSSSGSNWEPLLVFRFSMMFLWWAIAEARWKQIGEIIIIGEYFKTTVKHSLILFQSELVQTPSYFREQANYSRAAQKIVHFSAVLEYIMTYLELYIQKIIQSTSGGHWIGFYQGRKLYWSWSNGPMAALQENGEPQFSLWKSWQLMGTNIWELAPLFH
jgi:trehalose utilization protein